MYCVIRKVLLYALPFIIIFFAYIILDPFMVLYNHNDYNKNFYIHKNLDFISTEKFLRNLDDICYDSYIFGGSTSQYTTPSDWKRFINTTNEVFSFQASSEHIIGIWSKINYIHINNMPLRNALLVFDNEVTFGEFENDNPIFMKHYEIYPSSKGFFHYSYFLNFINIRFLVPYLHYNITKKFYSYMDRTLVENYYYYERVTNEYHNIGIIEDIEHDSLLYYEKRRNRFQEQIGKNIHVDPQISQESLELLYEIKKIFDFHNTDYQILISPSYNQKVFNKKDIEDLKDIFGSNNVHDFTGVNSITSEKSNFYDELHFKKYIGARLMEIIYLKNKDF